MPRSLWVLDGVFFAFAAVCVCLAPCGLWRHVVWGESIHWDSCDPGGPYAVSSLFFFRHLGHPPFDGHPGITLQALIALGAHAVYGVRDLAGNPGTYLEFWARNIRGLFIMGGLISAATHVLSFHVIYALAMRLLGNARAAFLGVLAYATLYPTLFFATRISVEPIVVSLVLLSIMSLWRMQEAWGAGRRRRAYGLTCLAGLATAAAIVSKLHLTLPLAPLCLLQILAQSGGERVGFWRRITERYKVALCYVAVSAILLAASSVVMDWRAFFDTWRQYTPDNRPVAVTERPADETNTLATVVRSTWENALQNLQGYFSPHTYQFVFTVTESGFVVIAALGLIGFWVSGREKRALVVWPLLYGLLLLPIVGYRGSWHYFFVHLAVASVFFGFAVEAAVRRFLASRPACAMMLMVLLVLGIHSVSIALTIDTRSNDVRAYRNTYRALHQEMERLRPGERIAVIGDRRMALWKVHGGYPGWTSKAEEFHTTFERMLILLPSNARASRQRLAKNGVVAIVDIRHQPARVETIRGQSRRVTPSPAVTEATD